MHSSSTTTLNTIQMALTIHYPTTRVLSERTIEYLDEDFTQSRVV